MLLRVNPVLQPLARSEEAAKAKIFAFAALLDRLAWFQANWQEAARTLLDSASPIRGAEEMKKVWGDYPTRVVPLGSGRSQARDGGGFIGRAIETAARMALGEVPGLSRTLWARWALLYQKTALAVEAWVWLFTDPEIREMRIEEFRKAETPYEILRRDARLVAEREGAAGCRRLTEEAVSSEAGEWEISPREEPSA